MKEYNNRWVLIAWEQGRPVPQNLPLDRILNFRQTAGDFPLPLSFNPKTYFQHLLGTTKTDAEPQVVTLRVSASRGKYVETKKIHPSQEIHLLPNGDFEVCLFVEVNQELIARLLEFGKDIEIVGPLTLRSQIIENLQSAINQYIE